VGGDGHTRYIQCIIPLLFMGTILLWHSIARKLLYKYFPRYSTWPMFSNQPTSSVISWSLIAIVLFILSVFLFGPAKPEPPPAQARKPRRTAQVSRPVNTPIVKLQKAFADQGG
jgi:hypothetical protein